MLFDQPLAIVDLETTGGRLDQHRVIEVGVLRIEAGQPVRRFSTLVNPDCAIPGFITHITGITAPMVQRAPLFDTLSATLSELLSGCLFIAHNVFFDYRFLQYEFARLGLSFTAPLLCSVRLSRLLYPDYRHHNLGVLIDRFQLGATQRHRALDDAEAVWQFLLRARCDKGHEAMDSAIHALVRRPDTAGDALAALVLADAPVAGAAT